MIWQISWLGTWETQMTGEYTGARWTQGKQGWQSQQFLYDLTEISPSIGLLCKYKELYRESQSVHYQNLSDHWKLIAARDKGKSKHVEFEAKTDDDVLLDRPNLVCQLQMDHLERGTFLAWSPLVGLGPPSPIRNYKTTKWGWTRLSKQIATNPHDAKGGKYPGKLQLQPNIWGNPKLNLLHPHIFHNPKLLELYRNGYVLGPLRNNWREGDSTFPRKLIFIFSVLLKGSLHSKVTKKSDNEMFKRGFFLGELSLAESPYKGFPLL